MSAGCKLAPGRTPEQGSVYSQDGAAGNRSIQTPTSCTGCKWRNEDVDLCTVCAMLVLTC